MKIQPKLVLLVLGIAVILSLGTTLVVLENESSRRMESEKNTLNSLSASFKGMAVAVNRIPYETFGDRLSGLKKAADGLKASFSTVDQFRTLPGISTDVKTALDAIRNLKELADQRLVSMMGAYDTVVADASKVFLFTKTVRVLDFYTYDFSPDKRAFLEGTALPHVTALLRSIETQHDTLARSIQTIEDQYQIIDQAVADSQAKSALGMALVLAAILALTLAGALVLARGIARSVVAIAGSIASLKDGDLTGRSRVVRRDEIGALSSHLNQFMDAMTESLREIQEVSNRNLSLKNSLTDATNDATAAITEISANTVSMGNQIRGLDGRIAYSADEITGIAGTIGALGELIVQQKAVNEQSSSSVLGMVESLDQLEAMTRKDLVSVVELVQISETGRQVFDDANQKIAEVPRSVEAILEMASVIDNLATQTNLLAMNAAIEAAHAGAAGRGFSVVAEEIRKLAEASTESSRHISASIKKVIVTIDEASHANEQARSSFDAVDAKIQEVSRSLEQIQESLSSVHQGSREVLSHLADQDARSAEVERSSASVEQSSQRVKQIMAEVSRISGEVTANINEIAIGVDSVAAAVARVSEVSAQSGEGSARLDREVQRFTLASPDTDPTL